MIYRKLKEFVLAREPGSEPEGEHGGEHGGEPRAGRGPAFQLDFARLGMLLGGAGYWALHSAFPIIAHARGDDRIAEAWAERLVALSDELGFDAGTAHALALLGDLSAQRLDHAAAEQWYGMALELYEKLGDQQNAARMLHAMADVERAQEAPRALPPEAHSEALKPRSGLEGAARAALVKLGRPIEKQARKRWLGLE
jgi:hypothetical protein